MYYNRKKYLMDSIDSILPCGENKDFDNWLMDMENFIDEIIYKLEDLRYEMEMLNDNL